MKIKYAHIVFILLLVLSNTMAQGQSFRSDTLSASIHARYIAGGIEFPFKNHSFGIQGGYTLYLEGFLISNDVGPRIVGIAEYKRFLGKQNKPHKHYYLGSYLMFENIRHPGGDEGIYSGWYESNSISFGPMLGVKHYYNQRLHLEYFIGIHAGRRWGTLRYDQYNPVIWEFEVIYKEGNKTIAGVRAGICLNFHLFNNK